MRVTESMTYTAMRSSIQTAQARNLEASNVSSSGKRVATSGDDPAAYAQGMAYQRGIAQLDSMDRATATTTTDLSAADTALSTGENLMDRIKEIAVAGSSSTLSPTDRASYADEVDEIRQEMLNTANTQVDGNYVFSGGQTQTPTFDSSGTYGGDSTVRTVQVGPHATVTGNVLGSAAFQTAGGVDTFKMLSDLETSLRTGTAASTQPFVDQADTAKAQITAARTQVGATENAMTDASAVRDSVRTSLQTAKSSAVEADTADSASKFQASPAGAASGHSSTAQANDRPSLQTGLSYVASASFRSLWQTAALWWSARVKPRWQCSADCRRRAERRNGARISPRPLNPRGETGADGNATSFRAPAQHHVGFAVCVSSCAIPTAAVQARSDKERRAQCTSAFVVS